MKKCKLLFIITIIPLLLISSTIMGTTQSQKAYAIGNTTTLSKLPKGAMVGGGANITGNQTTQLLQVGQLKNLVLGIFSNGVLKGTSVTARAEIHAQAEIFADGTAKVDPNSLSGTIIVKDNKGNNVGSMQLQQPLKLSIMFNKVTVRANFVDQDGDKGRYSADIYLIKNVNQDSNAIYNSSPTGNQKVSIIYNHPHNQKLVSVGTSVEAQLGID